MNKQLRASINKKRYQAPLKSYLWRVELPSNVTGFTTFSQLQDISTRVVTFNSPFTSIETDKEITGNSFWYFAKSSDIGSITLEVIEYEDGLSFQYFKAWQNMVTPKVPNASNLFNPPSYYKGDIRFIRMNSYKKDIWVDTYKGYFPTAISDLANDYETNGIVRFSVTLTGDDVVHEKLVIDEGDNKLEYKDGGILGIL